MDRDNLNVLVIAPHHDDEVIGCGGLISLLVSKGYNVSVVHVFNGSSGVAERSSKVSQKVRHVEAVAASKIVGFTLIPNLNFDDRLPVNTSDIQNALVKVIRKIKPSIILTPHRKEHDFEHALVSRASWEASWLATTTTFPKLGLPAPRVKAVLGYEVWTPIERPNFYIDITKYVPQKKEALKCYKSQIENTSWLDGATGLNAYRGTTLLGSGYAEVYNIEPANIVDVVNIFKLLTDGDK